MSTASFMAQKPLALRQVAAKNISKLHIAQRAIFRYKAGSQIGNLEMIRSYTTEIGKDLFDGNWSIFPSKHALEPLEDCFIDLRILDAVATKDDVERAFRGRVVQHGKSGSGWKYSISQPSRCPFEYRIDFLWAGENVESVSVTLLPANKEMRTQ